RIPILLSTLAPLFGTSGRECNANDQCWVRASPLLPIPSGLWEDFVSEDRPCPAIRDLDRPTGQFVSPELVLELCPQDDFHPTAGCQEQDGLRHLCCLSWTATRLRFGRL